MCVQMVPCKSMCGGCTCVQARRWPLVFVLRCTTWSLYPRVSLPWKSVTRVGWLAVSPRHQPMPIHPSNAGVIRAHYHTPCVLKGVWRSNMFSDLQTNTWVWAISPAYFWLCLVSWNRVSLPSFDCPGTHYADQVGLQLTKICLSLDFESLVHVPLYLLHAQHARCSDSIPLSPAGQPLQTYHFIIDFMEMNLTDFLHNVFILKGDKAKP